ncbi:hypothetical protein [Enterovirga sp.]|uniref:hypothetical protein n=1 Tax=Enterovirga sp. TaxID=2026350 RepID=UPI002B73D334|nr:hypothetical protein [Enterovirga sp.]HMO29194.1 hypothetical protein [Enterovirga sp.]
MPLRIIAAALLLSALASSPDARAGGPDGRKQAAGTPLPRCVLYSSVRLTPQGMMQCSYQCGDRIVVRGGYNSCASSVARPAPNAS